MDLRILSSADVETYRRAMEEEVLPYLKERGTSGYYETLPGQKLYYERYLCDQPRGLVVFLHGFTEGVGKHRESIWQFLQAGYHVWALQQREHGLSYRSTRDLNLVHITDYRQLVRDVHGFLHQVVLKDAHAAGLPRLIYGHSMGGGVTALSIESYPDDYQRAILSSPMLGMKSDVPVLGAAVFADVMLAVRQGQKPLPGSQPFSAQADYAGSYSGSEGRYQYWFQQQLQHEEYQMSVCTIATARQFLALTRHAVKPANCQRVKIPLLMLSSGADTVVDNAGQDKFMQHIRTDGRMIRFEGAKHELYMGSDELLKDYWTEIRSFLDA